MEQHSTTEVLALELCTHTATKPVPFLYHGTLLGSQEKLPRLKA
jgi:hypothetical protein